MMVWLLILCSICTLWPLLDNTTLIADYLGQFRLQLMLGYLVLLGLLLWKRHALGSAFMGMIIMSNIVWIIHASTHHHVDALDRPADKALRVISFNVWKNNARHDDIVNLILESQADIVWLQEVKQPLLAKLETELLPDYPHYTPTLEQSLPQGTAFFSKYPFSHHAIMQNIDGMPHRMLHARVDIDDAPLEFIGVHLRSPRSKGSLAVRQQQMAYTSGYIAEHISPSAPLIFAGDMNSVPWRPAFKQFRQASGLNLTARLQRTLFTWPSSLPTPFSIPIDHIMTRPSYCADQISRGKAFGSDHAPIMVTLHPCIPHNL